MVNPETHYKFDCFPNKYGPKSTTSLINIILVLVNLDSATKQYFMIPIKKGFILETDISYQQSLHCNVKYCPGIYYKSV